MFNKMEKFERVLFSTGYGENSLKIKIVNILGVKRVSTRNGASESIRLSPLYEKSYQTKKYDDVTEVSTVRFTTSDYLVFEYNGKDAAGKFVSEEIYLSHPHIVLLKEFLKTSIFECAEADNFGTSALTAKGQNLYFESPIFANKKLKIAPGMISFDNDEIKNVITFFIDKDENFVDVDLNSAITIFEMIDGLDFIMAVQTTLLMAMMYDNASGGSYQRSQSSNTYNSNNSYTRSTPTATSSRTPASNQSSASPTPNRTIRRPVQNNPISVATVEEESTQSSPVGKTRNFSSKGNSKSGVDLNSIINQAEMESADDILNDLKDEDVNI